MKNQIVHYTLQEPDMFCVETPVTASEEYYDFHFDVKFNYFKQLLNSSIPPHKHTQMFDAYLDTVIRVLLSDPHPYTIFNLYEFVELYVYQPTNAKLQQHPLGMVFTTYNDQFSILLYTQLQKLLIN